MGYHPGRRYQTPQLIDTAPGTFESLVGSLLGGYQDQHELKRRRQIEDQDRLAAEEERKRQQARQDAADADSRTSFDLGMSKEGYSRDTVVSAPDPNIVAAPTLGHLGNFTRTGLSDADRSITREAADKVAAAEAERQKRIRIGKALGAPDRASAIAMLAQDDPASAVKLYEEGQKPKNIDPNSPEGIKAQQDIINFRERLQAHLRPPKDTSGPPKRPVRGAEAAQVSTLHSAIGDVDTAMASFIKGTGGGIDPATGEAKIGDKNVTGRLTGTVLAPIAEMFGKADPDKMSARRDLGSMAASIRHKLLGANMTPAELQSVEPFLPTQNQDEAKVFNSLQGLKAQMQRIYQDRLNALEASGADVSGFVDGPAGGGGAAIDHEAAADAWLANRRRKKAGG